jgi:hypothetical protein
MLNMNPCLQALQLLKDGNQWVKVVVQVVLPGPAVKHMQNHEQE